MPTGSRYELIAFDLDGTLVETRYDIAASVNRSLVSIGREALSVDEVLGFIGDGAPLLLARALGAEVGSEIHRQCLDGFLADYHEHCLDAAAPYEGVPETLAALADLPLCVLTNKPLQPAQRILAGLGLDAFFRAVLGGDNAPAKKPDPRGLEGFMRQFDARPETTLLVGDSAVDVQTARNAGTQVVGVNFGFRPDQLDRVPPDHRIDAFTELLDLTR